MYRVRKKLGLFCVAAILAATLFGACGKTQEQEASGTGVYFDTVVEIRIFGERAEALLEDCFRLCAEWEEILSAQKEGSELWKLNHRILPSVAGEEAQAYAVSTALAECLSAGLTYGELSDGAFDVTIYPLRELWDFEGEGACVPDAAEVAEALTKVDYQQVHVEGNTVWMENPDTQIDLGGIAKGYISQSLYSYLLEQGCTSALLNLGGNVRALGSKPDGSAWTVGLQKPFAERGEIADVVEIRDGSVISSGTYERYFEEDGVLYHHILDPSTGYPVQTEWEQATVIGQDDVLGDALSTICILLGKERAEQLVQEQGWEVSLRFLP